MKEIILWTLSEIKKRWLLSVLQILKIKSKLGHPFLEMIDFDYRSYPLLLGLNFVYFKISPIMAEKGNKM